LKRDLRPKDRPEELVLAAVVRMQSGQDLADVRTHALGPSPVASSAAYQLRQQPGLPPDHPVDEQHFLGVYPRSHEVVPTPGRTDFPSVKAASVSSARTCRGGLSLLALCALLRTLAG